uniref:NADH-ubiquinone oxidoreductase chain 3 n=1 Tax=Mecistops cataphractus TaxID=184780 RepID=B2WVK4_9SAUR|nr:NADH dehydrogenase subunit 3 [Mecistops cataphractus]ABP62967.1 NADH dehydrogenase subunit 3 [Mecistops cataphractus]AER37431.1 NADH dehydrogenase subunit 3 [Mecistops cataphractus]AER37448.1 NADH dehydrogenase subunit 3 [Mecistops cataphractus]AER37450.1 NADH dehydrogenase subunit 3 [Mecistops cataphractus]AER37467.1 NADH dehydrogenase subunit 3 [Mecistops cataphractus]
MNLLTLFMLAMATAVVVITMNLLMSEPAPDSEKLSPYECGFDPLGSARLPLSIRFFMVAILFLLFDLEIAILLPLAWALQLLNLIKTVTLAIIIFSLMFMGLAYEWLQGGLEWAE